MAAPRLHSLLAGVPLLAFAAIFAALLALSNAANIHLNTDSEGWHRGRATYFGASPELVETFERVRGAGSYGDLHYGSCGMYRKPQGVQTIRPQDLPFDQTYAAAAADANPDFPGSCGRCYEVGCVPGVVPKDYHDDKGSMTPFKTQDHFYMPKVDQSLKDTKGRLWLGNPWENEGLQGALCWGNETTWVRIVDSCPPNPLSPWCRADSTVFHFDMSYWAFEKLAHPLYGVMPIRFRPIDCDTKKPLVVDTKTGQPSTEITETSNNQILTPGFISKDSIYNEGLRPGWTMFTWLNGYQLLSVHGAAEAPNAPPKKKESPACASLLPGGGMRFACRGCQYQGYQPFLNATFVSFRVKADNSVMKFPSTPPRSIPPLKAYLIRAGTGGAEENYCGEAFLQEWPESTLPSTLSPSVAAEGWHQFDIPISKFMCNSATGAELIGFGLSHANATVPVNNGARAKQSDYIGICVDDIKVGRGVVPGAEPKPITWAGAADKETTTVATKKVAAAPVAEEVAPAAPAAAATATKKASTTTATTTPAAAATATKTDEAAAVSTSAKTRWATGAAEETPKKAAAPVAGAATATAKST